MSGLLKNFGILYLVKKFTFGNTEIPHPIPKVPTSELDCSRPLGGEAIKIKISASL